MQRLACIGITGAMRMRTCPTAALESLLNILQLHIQGIKLKQSENLRPGYLKGHFRFISVKEIRESDGRRNSQKN